MKWKPALRERLRELAAEGVSKRQIAEELGCDVKSVRNAACRYRVRFGPQETEPTEEEIRLRTEELRQRWQEKLPGLRLQVRAEVSRIMQEPLDNAPPAVG